MMMVGYYNPEQDVDGFFPLIKGRLLNVIQDWLAKGWLTAEELQNALLVAPIREPAVGVSKKASSVSKTTKNVSKRSKT